MGKPPLTEEQIAHAVAEYERGRPVAEIAREIGRSRQALHNLLRRQGVPPRPRARSEHGTVAMWLRHYRAGEDACEACEDAWKAYWAGRWQSMTDEEREEHRRKYNETARKRANRRARRRRQERRAAARRRLQREREVEASVPDALRRLGRSLDL